MAVRVASLYADVEVRATEAERQLGGLRQELDRTQEAATQNSTRFTELQSALGLAQQAYAGVAQVVQFTASAINEGAQLQVAKAQFDNLTASIGSTSESMLNDLRAATNGMVSDAQLMTSATDIISLGLASTQEDTVRLANAVGTLGLDMQQVILTFANNSKARLDSLGLSIQDVDRITQEYVAAGKSADEAFDLAVLDALEDRMELLGSTADTTAGSIAKLTAHQENLTNKFNEFMAVQWEPILGGLVNSMDAVEESTNKGRSAWLNAAIVVNELDKAINPLNGKLNPISTGLDNWIDRQKELTDIQFEATHATDEQVAGYERLIEGYNTAFGAINMVTDAEIEQMAIASEAAFMNSELSDKVQQLGHHMTESEALIYNANAALRDQASAASEAHGPLSEGISLTDRINAEIERLNAQPKDFRFNMSVSGLESLREAVRLASQMGGQTADIPDPFGSGDRPDQNAADDDLQRPGGADFASGTSDFVVPPGFPNDSFNIGLTSGEHISVTNGGGQAGGNGNGGMTVNGPLIGAVYQQSGEDTDAFASRVTTMITEKMGELN